MGIASSAWVAFSVINRDHRYPIKTTAIFSSEEKLSEVIRTGGKVEVSELLRRRVRYFSDGMAIGSRLFLKEIYEQRRDCFPESRKARFATMKGADWGGLQVVRDLKVNLFG